MTGQTKNTAKVYVDVLVGFDKAGYMKPLRLVWEDGEAYKIDRVLDVRPAPAMKAGSQGDRYTIRIRGRESFLFFERGTSVGSVLGRWFVERR